MARRRGTFTLSSNIELEAGAPLDSRDIVQSKDDLTNGSFPYSYVGMETYVRSEGKKYRLIGDDPTVLSNWVEVGSGSGSEVELVEISEEDYAALTTEEKNDPTKVYFRYEANGLFKSIQDDPEATTFEGEKLATGRTIESVVDGKLEEKLDLTGGTMTGDLLTDTQTDIHAQRNLYLGNTGTSQESKGRSQLHFRRSGGGTNGITTLTPLQSIGTDGRYDGKHYTQYLQCKSGTVALLEDVNKKADLTTVEGSTSVSGNPIVIEDAANAYAEEVIANIEPIQDLHGYDHPWVGGAGKNKLPLTVDGIKAANTDGTWSGNVYTINNGTFTILTDIDNNVIAINANGQFNADSELNLPLTNNPKVTTVLNGCPANGSASTYSISMQQYDGAGHWGAIGTDYGSGVTYSGTSYDYLYPWITIKSGYSASNLLFYPMIRLSTESDSAFAPYTNICPITGITQLDIDGCGKNLFDKDTITNNYRLSEQGEPESYSNYAISDYIRVFAGITYFSSATSSGRNFLYDNNKNVVSQLDNSSAFSFTPTVDGYVRLSIYNPSGKLPTFQIEKGNTATSYEPYEDNSNTIDLGRTVYGGTLNVQTGELVVDRAFVEYDGSSDENWTMPGTTTARAFLMAIALDNRVNYTVASEIPPIIANYMKAISQTAPWGSNNAFVAIDTATTNALYTGINTITSVEAWRTYLANNPLQVCYELATPQTYHLTPSQVKLLLNHNNISTNADTLYLTYQVNNVLGEILSESEEYTDRAVMANSSNIVAQITKTLTISGVTISVYFYKHGNGMKYIKIHSSNFPSNEYLSPANFIPNEYKSIHNDSIFFAGMNGLYTSTNNDNRARMMCVTEDGRICIFGSNAAGMWIDAFYC